MTNHYPLSVEQLMQATHDVSEMAERALEIAGLLSAGYGESDPRSVRAQEVHAAVQRLQWAMERSQSAAG